MSEVRFAEFAKAVLEEIESKCQITDHLVDKDQYRIFLATIWANLVLDPSSAGFNESDLEHVYDALTSKAAGVLGGSNALKEAFQFLTTKEGEASMGRAKLTRNHQNLIAYFASMMIDPEGHRKWMDEVRKPK